MIKKDLPKDGAERKVIVFMEDYELEIALLDKTIKWLNDPNICVLEYPDEDIPEDLQKDELYIKLKDKGLIGKNDPCVLVQNPYNLDDYSKADDLKELLRSNAMEKYSAFSVICKHLGATKVIYESKEDEFDNTILKIIFNAGYKFLSGKFNTNLREEIKKSISLEGKCEFPGSASPDIEKAKKTLESYNLGDDINLKSLITKRTGRNKMIKENVALSMTSESMKSVKIAANVKFGLFDAEGKFHRNVESVKDISITVSVEFGKG
jgi:hypothetical protein